MGLFMSLFCLVGRLAAVLPTGILCNGIKMIVARKLPQERNNMISWKHMFMMWHSGLRGGVSLYLATDLGDWVDATNGPGTKQAILDATFFIICAYLLLFGGTAGLALHLLGLPVGVEVDENTSLFKSSDTNGFWWNLMLLADKNFASKFLLTTSLSWEDLSAAPLSNAILEAINHHSLHRSSSELGRVERKVSHISKLSKMRSKSLIPDRFNMLGSYNLSLIDFTDDGVGLIDFADEGDRLERKEDRLQQPLTSELRMSASEEGEDIDEIESDEGSDAVQC